MDIKNIKVGKVAQAATALLVVASFFAPSVTQAASASITELETTANVSASTIPAVTTAGGVTEVKATRTLTVNALPANAETIVIGTCTVTFTTTAGSTSDDTNCTGGATIDTNTGAGNVNRTAGDIAVVLQSLTNVSDTGHGALTVGAPSGTTVSFTTTGTETTAAVVTFTDGTTGDISSSASTAGVVGVASTVTITITGALVASAADHSVNVDALGAIDLGTAALTAAQVAGAIRTGITGAAGYGAKNYTVSGSGADITFTRKATGSSGNASITLTDASYGAKAQVVTFTPVYTSGSFEFGIGINGTGYQFRGGNDIQSIVEGLVAELDADTDVTCTEDDTMVTCTADTAGTAFTYSSWATTTGGGGGGGGHSSGGGSSKPKPTTPSTPAGKTAAELQAMLNDLMKQLEALKGGSPAPAASGTFMVDLDLGAQGADVTALQNWLIAKGFKIEAGATGYFGAQTQAALAAYQKANGITPAAGFFGPKTRAMVNGK